MRALISLSRESLYDASWLFWLAATEAEFYISAAVRSRNVVLADGYD